MPSLLFHKNDELLFQYRLEPGRTTIGRADTSDLALPGDDVSRTHCIIDWRGDQLFVVDRSKHGTLLDDEPVGRAPLDEGSRIGIGPYEAVVSMHDDEAQGPTRSRQAAVSPDALVAVEDGRALVECAELVVTDGPVTGLRRRIRKIRTTVGGERSTIELVERDKAGEVLGRDAAALPDHCRLVVSRGRVMVEPVGGPVMLDGERLRGITPLYAGEQFRIGQSTIRIDVGVHDELPYLKRFGEMVGESPPMRRVFGLLRRVAEHDYPVLITGESGTGKELAARGIHEHSARAGLPYVAVNCGAIPPELFESELFGHEKGAFTGAERRKDGAFHHAHGGTLFLDEVGELPDKAQAKLLRTLESGEVRRVGATEVGYPDVRVVAATNRDLSDMVRVKRFREDLFFRLAVLTVQIPPLRRRPKDLAMLCEAICKRLHPEATVSPAALELLGRYDWPGNVRELRNVLTRAFVQSGRRIDAGHLSFYGIGKAPIPDTDPDQRTNLDDVERSYIVETLRKHADNRSAAARELGIARSTLHYKLRSWCRCSGGGPFRGSVPTGCAQFVADPRSRPVIRGETTTAA